MASDVGSDVEDFEATQGPRRRKKPITEEDEEAGAPSAAAATTATTKKKPKTGKNSADEDAGPAEDAEEDPGPARRGEEPPPSFVRPDHVLEHDATQPGQMYAKTMNVKDICSIITGCCSVHGVETVLLTFSPLGLEFYTRAAQFSAMIVSAFYSKANFCQYNVHQTIKHVVRKSELDDLKKRIAKDVDFLEITNSTEGFIAGGRRTYKTGGGCDFQIQMNSMDETLLPVVDMSTLNWNMQVRTASQHFSDNVAFFGDQDKFIQLALKPKLLEFSGIRDTGSKSKQINQTIISEFTGQYRALFQKKMLKTVTAARDINRALCISFNLTELQSNFPVHFQYELGQDHPQSHFSVYIGPSNADDCD